MIKRIKLKKINKKAQVGNVVQDFVAAITIIFLLFAFYIFSTIIFNVEKKDLEIKAKNQALLLEETSAKEAILDLKYNIDGGELNIKELAKLAELDEKYKSILDAKILEIKNIYPNFKLEDLEKIN